MLYRCQTILKHVSGLPRDNFTNTFFFQDADGAPSIADAEAYAEHVRDFYVTARAPQVTALSSFLSPVVTTNGHEVRVYPVDTDTGVDPRGDGLPPLHTEVFDLVGRPAATAGAPSEVSLCLSFRNHTSTGVPAARRRGRIYFGPIEQAHVAQRAGSLVPEPAGTMFVALRDAGVALRTLVPAGGAWMVYSRPFAGRGEIVRPGRTTLPAIPARTGNTTPVTQVWVDDAFDTQRRRGEKATSKSFA